MIEIIETLLIKIDILLDSKELSDEKIQALNEVKAELTDFIEKEDVDLQTLENATEVLVKCNKVLKKI